MKTVRNRLKELMQEKAKRDGLPIMSQDALSEATGIPQGTLSRWVINKVDRTDKSIIAKLCTYFECGISDLLSLE